MPEIGLKLCFLQVETPYNKLSLLMCMKTHTFGALKLLEGDCPKMSCEWCEKV